MSLLMSLGAAAEGPPGRSGRAAGRGSRAAVPGEPGRGARGIGRRCRAGAGLCRRRGLRAAGGVSCRTVWRRRTGAALRMRASPPRLPTTPTITPSASTSTTGKRHAQPGPARCPPAPPPPPRHHRPAPPTPPACLLASQHLPAPAMSPPLSLTDTGSSAPRAGGRAGGNPS